MKGQTARDADEELYGAYRAEVSGDRTTRSLRIGAMVVAALNTGFILLDHWIYPDRVSDLFVARMLLNVAMAASFWAAGPRTLILGPVATGLGLIAVIGIAGGVSSVYSPAIMLLFLGAPVLLPLNARQAAGMVGALLAVYASLPLVTPTTWEAFAVNMFFPMAAAVECIASCALLDRMRFADFVQRRELERARDELAELDDAKSRFSANVHHELRTPLTLILAPLDGLRAGDFGELSAPVMQMLETMQFNGRRLYKLINNLLDLAKLENRDFEVHRRPIELATVLGEVARGAQPLAERKQIRLTLEGFESVPSVNADPDALEKVAVNLIGNALKFTEAGGSIRVIGEATNDGGIHLRFADDGAGIPPGQVDRIFDRFAQVDASSTRRHEGTGIGLSLTQELVSLHGGRIWATSDGLGCGATIHVVLPRGEVDEDAEELMLESTSDDVFGVGGSMAATEAELNTDNGDDALVEMERSVGRWEGRRSADDPTTPEADRSPDLAEVLVVDDNHEMRRLLATLIGTEFRVRLARNGVEALERLRESLPELVVTDVMMPEMSGTDLCTAIKSDPDMRGVPVMLVTSKADREMKIEGLERGADDYVTKPFHPRELMARVRSLVELRRVQQELAARHASLLEVHANLVQTEAQLVQAERLAAVGELAAGVAHEVNNPVNFALNAGRALGGAVADLVRISEQVAAIDWRSEAEAADAVRALAKLQEELGADELAETLLELVGIVTEGLQRTSQIVGNLRDFAAPGRSRRSMVDISHGLASTVQLVRHQLSESGAELSLDLADDLPMIRADAGALNQVYLNLLKNAAEAMQGRGGHIRVSAVGDDTRVRIAFADDGPGMTEDVRKRLFEPFFTTKPEGEGTGLGLSMCKQIVDSHDGVLEVESEPGVGTTFKLVLPVDGGEEDET